MTLKCFGRGACLVKPDFARLINYGLARYFPIFLNEGAVRFASVRIAVGTPVSPVPTG